MYGNSSQICTNKAFVHTMSILPCEHDVLCGRSKYCFRHPGNERFRALIAENIEAYKSAPTKKLKMQLVTTIVGTVISQGGRFLSQDSQGQWKNGDINLGKKKTGNALRDAQRGRIRFKTNAPNDCNLNSATHVTRSQEESGENNYNLYQVGNYSLRSRTKIISPNETMHQDLEASLKGIPEVSLEREWINKLRIEESLTLDPATDWKKLKAEKDRMNEYLDDCIVNELRRL
jgi:hypothetical protein